MSRTFEITPDEVVDSLHGNTVQCCSSPSRGIQNVSLQSLREMRHREYLKKHCGQVVQCSNCEKKWDTNQVVNSVLQKLYLDCKDNFSTYLQFPLTYEHTELMALRYQFDMKAYTNDDVSVKRLYKLLVLLFFNTHDWKHRKACFKKGNECRFNIPHKPIDKFTIEYSDSCEENLFSGDPSSLICKWYHLDGSYHNVCSYEILAKRDSWDVFVNVNNPVVSEVLGYNNNVCMGNINTLYYCTLYTSKSNQEEETYPYMKALEAVASRLRRVQENESESNISSRQVGLRHLLSGINSHISSSVVSATMAWYLVQHGTRFHFSHEFKPLLLTQFEAWYDGESYSQRIRHRKKRNKPKYGDSSRRRSHMQSRGQDNSDEETEVWMDSSVSNYLNRPTPDGDNIFENMSLWEYECKYEMMLKTPDTFMAQDLDSNETRQYFRFNKNHPGFHYSCLYRRSNECIPKLYYNNIFPDIEALEIDKGTNVEDHVLVLRKCFAKKVMLMFFPFQEKSDLLGGCTTLWQSFTHQKTKLLNHLTHGTTIDAPHLYIHSIQIMQNIQDLLNMKRIPKGVDALQACTTLSEVELLHNTGTYAERVDCHEQEPVEDDIDIDVQLHHLSEYVNLLSQDNSIFNSYSAQLQHGTSVGSHPSIVSIFSTEIENVHLDNNLPASLLLDRIVSCRQQVNVNEEIRGSSQSIITILTRALDCANAEITNPITISALSSIGTPCIPTGLHNAICSLEEFALQQNLDMKQKIAFKAICASFMFSYLTELAGDISAQDHEQLTLLLKRNGALQQLLMCVTGPGGSGKSHVIKCCRIYCKLFCDAIGKPFTFSVFPITATTNAAAALLQGCTIHSAAMLNKGIVQMEPTNDVDWSLTKLLIIDEISMATISLFKSLDKNLKVLTGNRRSLYGGIHIVFMGDFMQLAPVQGVPIFQNPDDFFWHQCLNSAVFLDVCNHRFQNDTVWGDILCRIQNGVPTDDDLIHINERLLGSIYLPDIVQCSNTKLVYGCYTNKKRNQINEACFLKYISSNCPKFHSSEPPSPNAIIIKGSVTKQNKDVGPEFHKIMWSLCGDDNLTVGKSCKVDPCLKLLEGYPLMVNTNTGKENNIVKGIMGNFIGVIWKPNCYPHVEDFHGYKVHCAYVSDVEYLILRLHVDGRRVHISPEVFHPVIKFPPCTKMKEVKGCAIFQFPVNVSLAITGHKLQGMTVDILVLSEVHLSPNWLYVLLSRVTSLKGLYLMKPLRKDMFKPITPNLRRELEWLRELETLLIHKLSISL
jgi:hypothetical protein